MSVELRDETWIVEVPSVSVQKATRPGDALFQV